MLYESVENPEECRWKIVKAMLDDFPKLKQRTKAYLEKA
jgi:hypothetical protein